MDGAVASIGGYAVIIIAGAVALSDGEAGVGFD